MALDIGLRALGRYLGPRNTGVGKLPQGVGGSAKHSQPIGPLEGGQGHRHGRDPLLMGPYATQHVGDYAKTSSIGDRSVRRADVTRLISGGTAGQPGMGPGLLNTNRKAAKSALPSDLDLEKTPGRACGDGV